MGAISGTKLIKTIFSFPQSIGWDFIGNALFSSYSSVEQLIHILYVLTINDIFYKPQKKSGGVKSGERWGQRMSPPFHIHAPR
jgi:hypothetical protein